MVLFAANPNVTLLQYETINNICEESASWIRVDVKFILSRPKPIVLNTTFSDEIPNRLGLSNSNIKKMRRTACRLCLLQETTRP